MVTNLSLIFLCCVVTHTHTHTHTYVGTQNMTIGLSLYLGSQSIYIVGFGFPTMGGSILGSPNTLLFPQIPLNS